MFGSAFGEGSRLAGKAGVFQRLSIACGCTSMTEPTAEVALDLQLEARLYGNEDATPVEVVRTSKL